MSINAQVVPWCTNTFLSILMMTLVAAGCIGCLSMHKLCLDAPTHFYECSRWPWMQLDVQDDPRCSWMSWMSINTQGLPWCTKGFIIYMDAQDDPQCSWMSWMFIDTQVLPWCTKGFIWMLKMTLTAAGCLGRLLMYKLCLVAPTHFYGCSKWASMLWMLKMAIDAAWCTCL